MSMLDWFFSFDKDWRLFSVDVHFTFLFGLCFLTSFEDILILFIALSSSFFFHFYYSVYFLYIFKMMAYYNASSSIVIFFLKRKGSVAYHHHITIDNCVFILRMCSCIMSQAANTISMSTMMSNFRIITYL